ncbi:MAG: tetratricopeptide repeat protein [Bacteroidales bacterium]|nr:tetratricopeptide repeat protein [Bacteroidales bacterium]
MKNILLALNIFLVTQVFGTNTDLFNRANKHYQAGEYSIAIELYDSIYQSGYQSFEMLYNMGNAYYEKEDYAKAILYWEKAKKLNPQDEDLLHNLELVQTKIPDQIEEVPRFILIKAWKSVVFGLSDFLWTILNILVFTLLVVSVYLIASSQRPKIKKTFFYIGILSFFTTIFTGVAGYQNYNELTQHKTAIIQTPTVNVKSSPDENSSTLFVLHSGTKIKLIDKIGSWQQISIANGNKGWIKISYFEPI